MNKFVKFITHLLMTTSLIIIIVKPTIASPILIQAGNQALRDDLRWLNDHGVIQLSTASWPLSYAAVVKALAQADMQRADRYDLQLITRLQKNLAQQYGALQTEASFLLRSESFTLGGFAAGGSSSSQQSLSVSQSGSVLAGKLQLNHLMNPDSPKQASANLSGSYLATSYGGQILYTGQLHHWWGPGSEGSLQWSSAATPLVGIGLRRASEEAPEGCCLSFIGPWSYELFLGRLQHDTTVPGARIFGMRLQAKPLSSLEVGFSRMFEWGGRGADGGLSSFSDSFLGRANEDATGGAVSNEVAGFDVSWTGCLWGNPVTLYGQMVGEDEAGKFPSQFIGLAGVRYQHRLDSSRLIWTVESSDTQSRRLFGFGSDDNRTGVAYRHDTFYHDGFYHDGMPIGHYLGGDGKSTALSLVVVPSEEHHAMRYHVRYEYAQVNSSQQTINLLYPVADTIRQVEGGLSGKTTVMHYDTAWGVTLLGRHSQYDGSNIALNAAISFGF